MEDGNIGIFGSSGYGKSIAAATFLMSFADVYTPEELHVYIFDFGNGTAGAISEAPAYRGLLPDGPVKKN